MQLLAMCFLLLVNRYYKKLEWWDRNQKEKKETIKLQKGKLVYCSSRTQHKKKRRLIAVIIMGLGTMAIKQFEKKDGRFVGLLVFFNFPLFLSSQTTR